MSELLVDFSKLSGLYYNYKSCSTENIRKYLKTIKIVMKSNDKYYALKYDAVQKISEKPRNISLSFDVYKDFEELTLNLEKIKTITYLVKSSSRFFLKPDIGEIFDQISYMELYNPKFDAICYDPDNHQLLDDTDGEHFIMQAHLLKSTDKIITSTEDFY